MVSLKHTRIHVCLGSVAYNSDKNECVILQQLVAPSVDPTGAGPLLRSCMDYKQTTNNKIQQGPCFIHIYRRDSSKAINQMLPKAEHLTVITDSLHKLPTLSFLF